MKVAAGTVRVEPMSFLLRATLVIAALSYCAANRDAPDHGLQPPVSVALLPSLWEALPPEIRERALREGTAQAGRHLASALALPTSRDTLAEADRKPAWRGVEGP